MDKINTNFPLKVESLIQDRLSGVNELKNICSFLKLLAIILRELCCWSVFYMYGVNTVAIVE